MQLFQTEYIGKRRLAVLRDILIGGHPEIDVKQLARDCEVLDDWSDGYYNDSMLAFFRVADRLRQSAIPDITLQIGDRAQITDSGLLGYAVLTAPTVQSAAELVENALTASNYFLRCSRAIDAEITKVTYSVSAEAMPFRLSLLEMSVLAHWRCIQSILPMGRSAVPAQVAFEFPEPTYAHEYLALFGCPVTFDAKETALAYPADWNTLEIPSGNSNLLRLCSAELQTLLGDDYSGDTTSAKVRRALIEHPKACGFSLEGTAEQLKLTPRTLRRYLAQEETSFREVCLDVRMELAKQYLLTTHMPLKAVGYQLGYQHPNNFYRAYQAYFSESPTTTRERAAVATASSH